MSAAPGRHVRPADDFFLHVEAAGAPQLAGGVAVLHPDAVGGPTLEAVRELVAGELPNLPRFTDVVTRPSTWRRPRWTPVGDVGLDWHVTERRSADGMRGLERIVTELAEEPLPRDRPLWRTVLVRDVGPDRSALVFLMQHALGDGARTVTNALQLMRPRTALPTLDGGPGAFARTAATVVGTAQLAADGPPGRGLGAGSPRRSYVTTRPDLAAVRAVAHAYDVRITDVVLGLLTDALATTHPELSGRLGGRLRVAVSRLVPHSRGETVGTVAVLVDVPLQQRPVTELLAEIGHRTARLRQPTRPMAARFVMNSGLRLLPEPTVGWFARHAYGGRFFDAVVTNFPGPTAQLTLGGVEVDAVYPIVPLAPGAPIALGTLSWNGILDFGLAADPAYVDATVLIDRMSATLAGLSDT